jgi:CRISPR-associated protein Csb2
VFAIAVELLTGRYTATQFNDRNRPEWPPHPARLFSALVATWADNDEPDPAERSALRWLEDQDPPSIHCGRGHERRVVTHFVPVNDATALTRDISGSYRAIETARQSLRDAEAGSDPRRIERARADLAKAEAKAVSDAAKAARPTGKETLSIVGSVIQMLPENRGKQGRTYPTVLPDDREVWFIWPDATPSEQQFKILDGLLARVGRIGHSSTLVSCRCANDGPPPTWVPTVSSNATRLRVPRPGSVSALENAYVTHQGEEPRTLPAGTVNYGPPGVEPAVYRSPLLGGDWYVLGIHGRRLPSAVQSLALTRATRNALLAHGDQPPPTFISGHQDGRGKTPPLDQPHLAIVPLINAGNPRSDGTVTGLALILPSGCADADREALERTLRSWGHTGFELQLSARSGGSPVRWKLDYLGIDRTHQEHGSWDWDLSPKRRTATRSYWCRAARAWVTVTPIALDRFPGNLRSANSRTRERAEAEAEESIARACVFAGLAERPDNIGVSVRLDAPLVGVPASPVTRRQPGNLQYPGYRTGNGAPRAAIHAEIEFDEPVRGPVIIGAGRYFGYGLCLPQGGR